MRATLWLSLGREAALCGRERSGPLSRFVLLRAGDKIDKFEGMRRWTPARTGSIASATTRPSCLRRAARDEVGSPGPGIDASRTLGETALSTLYVTHPSAVEHVVPTGHPERPARMQAVESALENERFAALVRSHAPKAEASVAELAHPAAYVEAIVAASPDEGFFQLDGDTLMSPGTLNTCLHAIGGSNHAVDSVMKGECANAFVAMRPPGHHAELTRAMGFCLFNHAAIAVRHAQKAFGATRVALVDWDVHHGNGSQDIFWSDKSVLYASTHQMPLFPGTGSTGERGDHDTIVNAPLSAFDGSEIFREAFEARILPRLDAFAPDLIVISAGFDAHKLDPLANIQLEEADFGWATRRLMEVADRHAKGRVVSILEGGYSLDGLARSVAAHVDALMGR